MINPQNNDAEVRAVGGAHALLAPRMLNDLPASAVVVLDGELRVTHAAGRLLHSRGMVDDGLVAGTGFEGLGLSSDEVDLVEVARGALLGTGAEFSCSLGDGSRCLARIGELGGGLDGGRAAILLLTEEGADSAELATARARAQDLESLAEAARALARAIDMAEVRETICEAAASLSDGDVVVLFEPLGDGTALTVSASSAAEFEGVQVPLGQASWAGSSFSLGQPTFAADLSLTGPDVASPLQHAGARSAIWQPVRRAIGIRGVIGIGWREPVEEPSDRLVGSLDLLAAESAVAIDRAAALERLNDLARTDPLTELSNRRAWQEELRREIARANRSGRELSIGIIDLDRLKEFNDCWGHPAGDRLLFTVAARWRKRLRLTDLLARIGGDEFAMTLPACGLAQGVSLADQLRDSMPDGHSCSIGIVEWSPGESSDELLARADRALYEAKNAGRNRTVAHRAPDTVGGPPPAAGAGDPSRAEPR